MLIIIIIIIIISINTYLITGQLDPEPDDWVNPDRLSAPYKSWRKSILDTAMKKFSVSKKENMAAKTECPQGRC